MSEPSDSGQKRPRRARRQRKRKPQKEKVPSLLDPARAVKQAAAPPVEGPADLPLSPDEVARLKSAFRFLKEHRNALKLRVNATEDLLLNAKIEPNHRGICQHLLAKVDKARVLQISERVPPGEATVFLAGVMRFAPDVAYLVRFLECVRDSSSQEQAGAALTQALGRVDFDDTSSAQMRKLLALIVDVFPEREQPAFLLSLLRRAPFREAFDRSADELPEASARMLVPLRAVHQLLEQSRKGRGRQRRRQEHPDPALLHEGALLLLRTNPRNLLEFEEPARRQLFHLLCDSSAESADLPVGPLLSLYRSLRLRDEAERSRVLRSLVGLLCRAGNDKEAKNLLRGETGAEAANLLAILDAPRMGRIALARPGRKRSDGGELWQSGVDLATQLPVRVCSGSATDGVNWARELETWQRILLPQVLLPLAWDVRETCSHPYIAVARLEASLARRLATASSSECRALALDLCRLANALGATGVELSGGSLDRFAVDASGRVWLTDALGATCKVNGPASTAWLSETLREVAQRAPGLSLTESQERALAAGSTPREVADALGLIRVP